MRESLYSDGAKQGTQAPSPAPRLIPAETEHQLRTNIAIGTANGGTSAASVALRREQMVGSYKRKRLPTFLLVAFVFMPATTYSPTHFRVQYNRPSGA